MELLSQSEYARRRKVSRQHISRLAKAGVLVFRGGKIDAAASDAVWLKSSICQRPSTTCQPLFLVCR